MNVVRIDSVSGNILKAMAFDTFSVSGKVLLDYVLSIPSSEVIVVVTHDDAFHRLGSTGRAALRAIGSTKIFSLNYRGNLAIVGQLGLLLAHAENLTAATHSTIAWGWAPAVRVSIELPLKSLRVTETHQRASARYHLCKSYVSSSNLSPLPLSLAHKIAQPRSMCI